MPDRIANAEDNIRKAQGIGMNFEQKSTILRRTAEETNQQRLMEQEQKKKADFDEKVTALYETKRKLQREKVQIGYRIESISNQIREQQALLKKLYEAIEMEKFHREERTGKSTMNDEQFDALIDRYQKLWKKKEDNVALTSKLASKIV